MIFHFPICYDGVMKHCKYFYHETNLRLNYCVATVMRLKYPMLNDGIDVVVENGERLRRGKHRNRKRLQQIVVEPIPPDPVPQPDTTEVSDTEPLKVEGEAKEPQPVLMVEVENVVHENFKQTEEVKVSHFCETANY